MPTYTCTMAKDKQKDGAPLYGVSLQAEAMMQEIVAFVKRNGRYEKVDEAAMMILAAQLDVFCKASRAVAAEGVMVWNSNETVLIPNPKIAVMNQAEACCLKIMKEYGLTALSRKNLGAMTESLDRSPLEKFMSGSR